MATPTQVVLTSSVTAGAPGYVTVTTPTLELDDVLYPGTTIRQAYDADGLVSITVNATDDSGVNPTGAYCFVSIRNGEGRRSFKTVIPNDASPIDLDTLIPATVGTPGFVWHGGGGGGGDAGLWVNFGDYGGAAVPGYDNTQAMLDAIDAAVASGAPGIQAPLATPGAHFEVDGRVYFPGNLGLLGNGPNNTVFEMTDAGAGFDFSYFDDTAQWGGWSGGFHIDAMSVATRPMVVGKRVSCIFSNFHVWNAEMTTGCNLVLDSTQNSLFETPWLVLGACNLRFDRGASSNTILKGEVAAATRSNIEFRATSASPAGQFPYTLDNVVQNTIIEGSVTATKHMIHSEAGALNKITNCYLSVNGAIFGAQQPTAMEQVVYAEASESAQSSLMIDNLQMNCANTSGATGSDVAVEADFTSGARIHWKGGSIGATPLGMRGNVVVESDPWFFGTVAQWYDLSGAVSLGPRREWKTPIFGQYVNPTDVVLLTALDSDSGYRFYLSANGVFTYNWDGSGSGDAAFGPLGAGIVGVGNATLFRPGTGITAARPGAPTIGCVWYDTTIKKLISWNGTVWKDGANATV